MSIYFDEEQKIFQINTKRTSYLIGLADGKYLGHMYYGKKMEDRSGMHLLRIAEMPFTPQVNKREKASFADAFPTEYSTWGVSDYRESCISVRNERGQRGCELLYQSHRIMDGKPGLPGLPSLFASVGSCAAGVGDAADCGKTAGSCTADSDAADRGKSAGSGAQTLEIVCADPCIGLEVTLRYSIFEDSDAIVRSVLVKNTGSQMLALERVLSACIDMDNEDFEMITLHGSWARERGIVRRPISYGKQSAGSVRGESSHQEHPFLALVTPGTNQDMGEVYAMNFVYSGNFLAQAELSQFDSVRMVMGIHPEGFEWELKPGAEFAAPEVVCMYSDCGLGQMTREFHDLYRNHLMRSKYTHRKRPILINNWEATYFKFDSDKLIAIAKEAAKSGIEMLVMDDGWFGKRNSDNSSLGDWQVDRDKLKDGLPALVEAVREAGLKFGIWMEPEMISPDSELYRAHPDWALQQEGREITQSREQYVLDFSRDEVVDYIYGEIAKVLHSADISYVKWDMNRQLSDVGNLTLGSCRQGEIMHRCVLSVYRMQEQLFRDFPDLLLENCSGGGARFDPGMLYYSPQIWCSDDMDPVERLSIQEGTALIYPLSSMGAHVCDCPNHTTGRTTPFKTRGDVALSGTFGYELDITRISAEDRAQIPGQIANYHRFHDLVREGDYYRIASWRENHVYDCWMTAAKDGSEALVTFVQVLAKPNRKSFRIKLRGLVPEAQYRIETDGEAAGDARPQLQDGRFVPGNVYSGEMLMYGGLQIPCAHGDYTSHLLYLTRI